MVTPYISGLIFVSGVVILVVTYYLFSGRSE